MKQYDGRTYPADPVAKSTAKFGSYAPVMKVFMLNLDTAQSEMKLGFAGTVLWAQDASDIDANVQVRFNSFESDPINFRLGQYIAGLRYSEVFVTYAAQPGKWIRFFCMVEGADFRALNPVISGQIVNINSMSAPDNFITLVDPLIVGGAAAAQILAANANRAVAIISNPIANAGIFRIGDAATGAARGTELSPGEMIEIHTQAPIFAYRPAGANENLTVSYTEYV